MADFKAIMTLAVAGRSYDEIVATAGCSRRDVGRWHHPVGTFHS